MPDISNINGSFVEEARIDIEDRGNQFGDGVYEVIRTYSGEPFCLDEHMSRLASSAAAIRIDLSMLRFDIKKLVIEAVERSGYENAKIYFHVSRGTAPRNHPFPAPATDTGPTFIMTVRELAGYADHIYNNGVTAILDEDIRWHRCDIKSLNLLPNVLSKQKAVEAGAFEAILHRNGRITEGSASNIFMVSGESIITTPADNWILSGVTRGKILELLKDDSNLNICVHEREIGVEELLNADEVFLSGTTIEMVPVIKIGKKIISEKPGPVFEKLCKTWLDYTKLPSTVNGEISNVKTLFTTVTT